jgi:coenzyme F420-reducing hydrogenase gamma subunit
MSATAIVILILAYGVCAAIGLMAGLIVAAGARRPEERHQMDDDQPPVRVKMWMGERE